MRPVLAATLSLLATVALAADPVTVPEGKFADIKTAAPTYTSVSDLIFRYGFAQA